MSGRGALYKSKRRATARSFKPIDADTGFAALTPTQREILALMCAGFTNKHIARKRGGSHRSVEWHREEIGRKLGIHNPVQLGYWAAMHGVELPLTLDMTGCMT